MNSGKNYSFRSMFTLLKRNFFSIFDLRKDTDVESTLEDVKAGIEMRGQTAWVLIFSILIASIGLNVNSTAVEIGAMLISPLMGPIVGMGLSLGINDIDFFKKAFKNFAVMIFLSLLTSALFFSIPLFQDETPEILARTFPDVRDVIVAFSGGLALIIALTRRVKIYNLIAGVAIATALMPPLCTAGYGLATAKWDFFFGAIFLFSINTVFIASGSFIVIRLLKFPYEKYANSKERKRISRFMSIVAICVLIPSFYTFFQLYKKSDFERKSEIVLNDLTKEKGIAILEVNKNFQEKTVSFFVVGTILNEEDTEKLHFKMSELGHSDIQFIIRQDITQLKAIEKIETIEKFYLATQQQLLQKQDELNQLKLKVKTDSLNVFYFNEISNEMKAFNKLIQDVTYIDKLKTDFNTTDTITEVLIKWDKKLKKEVVDIENEKLQNWLKVKTKKVNLIVKTNLN